MGETRYLARTDVIDEARDYVRENEDAEGENRRNAEEDLLFKAGEQWPTTIRLSREAGDNPRPCLTINEVDDLTSARRALALPIPYLGQRRQQR